MATIIHSRSGARVIGPGLPLDFLLSIIPSLPRAALARLTERAIDQMDELDGEPDAEDATDLEDEGITDFTRSIYEREAGCPVSDLGENAYAEWDSLSESRQRQGHIEGALRPDRAWSNHEDDEDSDQDQCAAGDDGCGPHRNGRGRVYWGSDQEERGT